MMKERPILFNAEMVRALLAGTKTQSRRIIRPQPQQTCVGFMWGKRCIGSYVSADKHCERLAALAPLGKPGDRLWVREAYWAWGKWSPNGTTNTGRKKWKFVPVGGSIRYQENQPTKNARRDGECGGVYKHARYMPRKHSRIALEITDVRVQRVQGISADDASSEGASATQFWTPKELDGRPFEEKWWDDYHFWQNYPQIVFQRLWNCIHGPGAWERNDWVFAYTFKRVENGR